MGEGEAGRFTHLPLTACFYYFLTVYHLTPRQQEVLYKYDPSSRVILYGCASPAEGELCSSRTTNGLDFEWEQVREGMVDNVSAYP